MVFPAKIRSHWHISVLSVETYSRGDSDGDGVSGASCGLATASEKLIGQFEVSLDLKAAETKLSLAHNGWVAMGSRKRGKSRNKGGSDPELHVSVRVEPDPRFVFQLDGEPECNPQVFQVQGNTKQAEFTCKFGSSNSNSIDRNLIHSDMIQNQLGFDLEKEKSMLDEQMLRIAENQENSQNKRRKFVESTLSSSLNATKFTKRQETIFKKAYELSTLCEVEVCVICYGPDRQLKTWPKDREKVKDIARRYCKLNDTKRRKGRVDLSEFLKKINQDDSRKKKRVQLGSNFKYPDWDPRFDDYSVEQLMEVLQSLERAEAVVEAQKQRIMQNTNMPDEEQRTMQNTTMAHQEQTMTIATMDHIQHHSNQDLMHLFNSTSSQIPPSASAFNQSQSLPPLPISLQIYYPGSKVENQSEFIGENETGIHEFQNANIFSRYMTVEDYLQFLGVQGSDTNLSQNMNLWGYHDNINTNALSHQFLQFPAQNIH